MMMALAASLHIAESSGDTACAEGRPFLVLDTAEGSITSELFEGSAPQALARIAEAVDDGPTEGVTFDYTHARIEIYTSSLLPDGAAALENEIDAEALGLHRDRIDDAGRAMDVFQQEIMPAVNERKSGGAMHPKLAEWVSLWRESHDASFLIGVSRQELNEAIGYVYERGLDSRPVTRGSLILKTESKSRSEARLGIALMDLPVRLGKQMVLGRVVDGLELAEAISTRALAAPAGLRSYDFAPRDPVSIQSIRFECRE